MRKPPTRPDRLGQPKMAPPRLAGFGAPAREHSGPKVHVAVLAFDGCMASSVTGPMELCAVANTLLDLTTPGRGIRFTSEVITTDGRPVQCGEGVTLASHRYRDASGPGKSARPDVVIVPGIWHTSAGGSFREVGTTLAPEAALLRTFHEQDVLIGGICSGTILLAEAGLLNGRAATTSWWLGEPFRRRYPLVRLALDEVVTTDGNVWCAGAATSHFNLTLKIIEHHVSADLAALVARFMLIDPNRASQAPYMVHDFRPMAADAAVARAQAWVGKHLGGPIALEEMAGAAAVSTRTLIRRFREATGLTPLAYVQKARVEEAKSLLSTGNLAVEKIVDRVGYADMSSFRRLFREHTGMTPHDYREKFRVKAGRTVPPMRRTKASRPSA